MAHRDWYACNNCGHRWQTRKEKGGPPSCPSCNSKSITNTSAKERRRKQKKNREQQKARKERLKDWEHNSNETKKELFERLEKQLKERSNDEKKVEEAFDNLKLSSISRSKIKNLLNLDANKLDTERIIDKLQSEKWQKTCADQSESDKDKNSNNDENSKTDKAVLKNKPSQTSSENINPKQSPSHEDLVNNLGRIFHTWRNLTFLGVTKDLNLIFWSILTISGISILISGELSGLGENLAGFYLYTIYFGVLGLYWSPIFQDKLNISSRNLKILMYLFQWLPLLGNLTLIMLNLSKVVEDSKPTNNSQKSKLKKKNKSRTTENRQELKTNKEKISDQGETSLQAPEEPDNEKENDPKNEGLKQRTSNKYKQRINALNERGDYRYQLLERIGRRLMQKSTSDPKTIYNFLNSITTTKNFRRIEESKLEKLATKAEYADLEEIRKQWQKFED